MASSNQHARLAPLATLTIGLAVWLWAATVSVPLGLAAAPLNASGRRVNVPNLTNSDFAPAIFWLGKVGMDTNYADVRVWHYEPYLKLVVHMTDRELWHATAPTAATLTQWDAVSITLDTAGSVGSAPRATSYRFVKQLGNTGSPASQAAFRGTGTDWQLANVSFTASDAWRGNFPNDSVWDVGWLAEFEIPFASLGMSAPPPVGSIWALSVSVHDRDDAAGTPIPVQRWPEQLDAQRPETWGELQFGRPVFVPSTTLVSGTTLVRHGLGGATVPDAAVGGHTVCGEGMNAWTEWGNATYPGLTQFNIQNQWDISDFMCFSKYYVTFPLTGVPPGKAVVSAKVRLTLFGNAGYVPGDARPSSIDVLTVANDWSEQAITWNTAPLASQNISTTRVHPVDVAHPAGPYEWDVSAAVADAYARGIPLRLVFYSTDGDYHSGKYFWTSNADEGLASSRPTLEVHWGTVGPPSAPRGVRVTTP